MILNKVEKAKVESGEYTLTAAELSQGEYEYFLMEGERELRRQVVLLRDM